MTARRNLAGKPVRRSALLRRARIVGLYGLLVGLAALSAQAYVRILTSGGNPLRRTDQANIQFLIHDQAAAGLTNADGETWITAGSDPRAALSAALDNWDRVADADLRFASPTDTSTAHVPDDGNHVFVFDDTPETRAVLGSALAIARSRFFLSGEIIDSDILFNPKNTINGQPVPFSTTLEEGTFDLEAVATHEVGHALGANHTHILAATMFPRTPPTSGLQAEVTGDDIAFAVEAYPAPGAQGARGSISGTVTLTSGGAARGVMLTAVEPNRGITVGTLSDFEDGTYELGPLPPGSYQVTAEPASGTVSPGDFQPADPAGFNTNVLSDFLGGAASPQTVQVLAGLDAPADFSLGEGMPGLSIQFVGVAAPGGSLSGVSIGRAAFPLTAGEAADLILAGPGIDATLAASHLRLLAPGLTIRPGSVSVEPGFTINGLPIIRATVDVDPRRGRDTGTLAIVKDGEVALFSGGLSIEGSDGAPPPPPPQPPPPPPPTAPAIVPTGVVISNLLPTINAISSESITSIFGSDFAPLGFVDRNATLDAQGLVSTIQSGVCVEIDGQRAPMFHVQFNQLNVQTPTLAGSGSVSVVVITDCDTAEEQRSEPEPVQVMDRTPAFFLLDPILNFGDANPVAASHLDFSKVDDPATHPGTTPAQPGEFISLWATGFGPTTPDVVAGEIPANVQEVRDNRFLAPIDGDFSVNFGAMTLAGSRDILYAGLASCCAGLYQIVLKVPGGLADGNYQITATVAGVSTPSGPFITVKSSP